VTLDGLREICKALPGATEDVKWGQDLCFCVGGKMFAAVNLEPPHQLGFKCSPEDFAELTEREGIVPAPYLARAMWVQESELGVALERLAEIQAPRIDAVSEGEAGREAAKSRDEDARIKSAKNVETSLGPLDRPQGHIGAGRPFQYQAMRSVIGGSPPSSRRRVAFCPRW